MDYEEKYKSALKWMQSLYGGLHGVTKEEAEHYFPELKEPNDERIRKALIEYFGEQCDMSDWNGVYGYQVIAWLEKQGKQKLTQNEEAEKIREEILGVARTAVKINGPLYGKKYNYEKWVDWFEKQNKTLDSEKVIEWMHQHLCTACWDDPNEAISLRIEQFKKDFGL